MGHKTDRTERMVAQQNNDDADRAVAMFCAELDCRKSAISVGSKQVDAKVAAKRIRGAHVLRRRRLGRSLVKQYREDTKQPQGLIDWSKFHQWLVDHEPEMKFISIVLTVISILLMI